MDGTVLAALITSGFALITVLIQVISNSIGYKQKADRAAAQKQAQDLEDIKTMIVNLDNKVNTLGEQYNELSNIVYNTYRGVALTIDGLEQKHVINGQGVKYLEEVKRIYESRGKESLCFHSLDKKGD